MSRRIAIICSLLMGLGSPLFAQEPATAATPSVRLATVTVAEVATRKVIGRVPIAGSLLPRDEVLIYPQVNGFPIETLNVDIGARVRKGEVLATLNDRNLTALQAQAKAEYARVEAAISQAGSQIASAQAGAEQAGSSLARTQTLFAGGSATQSALDQAIASARTSDAALASAKDGLLLAQAQLQQAQAQLDIATLNLEHAQLRAPVAGLVSVRNGQIGAIASSGGEPIFRIITDGVLEIEAEVIETALGQISPGDRAELSIASLGAASGTVRRISPTVDPLNRLGKVRIDTEASGLREGLFASGWIITDERDSPTVPAAAVLTDAQGTYVLVVKEGLVEKRGVTAGLIWDGYREIIEGVALGELVIAKAGAFFGDGDRINPVMAEARAKP
ncbi:MAG: efflux RND transporter periplasmic adaptor subunit [Pseudorhodobacter sp.]